MHSALSFLKVFRAIIYTTVMLIPIKVTATTLNFSAVLTNVTCSISLDKSLLSLGSISIGQFRPETLINVQPFILSVQNCAGTAGGSDIPIVMIRGEGITQDNKWLFRKSDSANNVGIMVIKSDVSPSYNQPEITNETALTLSAAGKIPTDQQYTFYAGASCGGTSGCSNVEVGSVTASLYFTFEYQ
ncbi:type 1 fimbrial protein [Escherichia coli]|uniref:fimbrial protein n=1 Tax=Escherichia coli TaxID=562 RepID=UPI0009295699|nr:fimbrial protein [Escherichia coli]MCA7593747.1 fimbrial protein [Escherichia coli]MQI96120.1 type 1 fimbrial protein [Escherichia coli]OJQ91664.1 hypothetical protein BK371_22340 [Escherichia coli]HBN0910106.1 type 1 fimbrial protein [Escherichia coli]